MKTLKPFFIAICLIGGTILAGCGGGQSTEGDKNDTDSTELTKQVIDTGAIAIDTVAVKVDTTDTE